MAKLIELKVKNFRGIKNFKCSFGNSDFICLIGRGDSGKTTILNAISYILSPHWNLSFIDSDFFNGDINAPIEIEATLIDLPDNLILENKYGLHIKGINKSTGAIEDELTEDHEASALTIKLEVKRDLEPSWYVINDRQDTPISISANDRAKLNLFMVSDYIDRHFSWNKGNPLNSIINKHQANHETDESNIVIEAFRDAKNAIDNSNFQKFEEVTGFIKTHASELGIELSTVSTTIDFKDISSQEGKLSLHDDKVPFRLKGKGTKRLISMAIQMTLAESGGIVLVDEIEQGLEPDRVQHLANILKGKSKGQTFLTTHSRDVLVELSANNIFIMRKGATELINLDTSMQGCIRKNPEAFFAKKIIVCEGATEVGIYRALNEYKIQQGKESATYKGVRFADGTGSELVQYCKSFNKAGYEICLFCDSDDKDGVNKKKDELKALGIHIIDCDSGLAIEEQVFKDLPWVAVKELIKSRQEEKTESIVFDSVKSQYAGSAPLTKEWIETDSSDVREAVGKAAMSKNNPWFKNVTQGEFMGNIIFKYLKEMNSEKKLKQQMLELSQWIDDE